jgi:hypothetical protein
VTLAPPSAGAPPRSRPAPTLAPEPAPAPPADVRPAEMPKPVTRPEPDVAVAKAEPPSALPEASPEAEESPVPPAPLALQTSSPPKSRPERVVEAKPVPAKPAAVKRKPEQEPDDPTEAAVLAAVKAAATRPTPATAPSVTEPTEASGLTETSLPSGPPLTGSEKEGLKLAVQKCWNVPAGLRDAQSLKVTIGAELGADGRVISASIRLIEPSPAPDGRFQQAYEAARRALIRCAPYTLPRDKYAQWREIEIVFNPEGMVSW